MTDQPDLYKLLQVDSEADPEVIQAAYRRLAQKFHPDLAAGVGAAERMVLINSAWEVLGDPIRRAEYDRQRALPRTPPQAAAPAGASARPSNPLPPRRPAGAGMPPPDPVSSNWTSGRSNIGGGYDERSSAGLTVRVPPERRPASRRAA